MGETIPGGLYINAAGDPVDAEGKPVKVTSLMREQYEEVTGNKLVIPKKKVAAAPEPEPEEAEPEEDKK